MKRFLSAVLALVCVMLLMPAAHAEQVKVSVTATPTELIDGGAVNFTFEIANYNADYPLMDVRIVYQGIEYDVLNGGSVPPSGTVRDIVLSLNVSESQLGQPLVFTVTWTLAGEPMSEEAEITIKRAADPVISVTRTANVQAAKPGDEIVLTYTIQNDTKFDITNIMLIDENISDNPILQHDALRASSSYSINHAYVMGEQSVVSAPFVTYTVNGKTKTFSSITPLTLTMMLVRLDMNIDMGAPTAQGVNFTFDIKNSGTQAVKSIQISDERANLVNGAPFSLAPGESTTFSFLVVPLLSEPLRNVKFLLTGIDPFNEAYTLSSSGTYEVYPFVDASEISVSARAETVTPWTSESGAVTARIIITNHSTVELTNVSVLEASIGVVKTFDVLPAGETAFDQEILLGSPRNLNFTIKGYDPTGANRELARCVLPVAYGMASEETSPATLAPEGTNIDLFGNIGSVITKILIVLGVLMVLSFAVLVALTMMERARAPFDVDDDEDDDLFDAGYGYAARGGPGRREDERGGGMRDEEINYTKRMLAIKDKETDARPTRREPIPLPPAETPVPRPQVFVEYEEPAPFMPERRPAAKAEPSRQTARTQGAFQAPPPAPLTAEPAAWRPEAVPPAPQPPYGAAASGHAAQYRPAGGKPLNVEPAMRSGETVRITPKVFDYRKQPAPQSMRRGDVVRVERRGAPEADDGQE